ncbi:MAG: type II toxin-antitoxin system prevent-host-death family antitoxin [Sedimenticola sp.]
MEISAKDLRSHTCLFLDAVDRGEEVIVTYRGRKRARVVRVESDQQATPEPAENSELFGLWADRTDMDDPINHVRKLRRGRFD